PEAGLAWAMAASHGHGMKLIVLLASDSTFPTLPTPSGRSMSLSRRLVHPFGCAHSSTVSPLKPETLPDGFLPTGVTSPRCQAFARAQLPTRGKCAERHKEHRTGLRVTMISLLRSSTGQAR